MHNNILKRLRRVSLIVDNHYLLLLHGIKFTEQSCPHILNIKCSLNRYITLRIKLHQLLHNVRHHIVISQDNHMFVKWILDITLSEIIDTSLHDISKKRYHQSVEDYSSYDDDYISEINIAVVRNMIRIGAEKQPYDIPFVET